MNKEMHMKPGKKNLWMLLAGLMVLSLVLSACGPVVRVTDNANNARDKNQVNVSQNGNGNETDDDQDAGANKITICHKTGSAQNPFVMIAVSNNAARNGHARHQGDIIPAPKDGCPSSNTTSAVNQDNDYEAETESDTDASANKITICHKTGSVKHPYVTITVSNDALKDGHARHTGDLLPAPEDGCPTTAIATEVPAK